MVDQTLGHPPEPSNPKKPTRPSRPNRPERTSNIKVLWFILPSLILSLCIISYPIIDLMIMSLSDVGSLGNVKGFAGLLNYEDVFLDDLFIEALVRTFYWTFFIVLGTIGFSIPIALVLSEDFYGRGLARTLIILPWAISLPLTSVFWVWILNPDYGMLNKILLQLGLIRENVGWLGDASTAFPLEILIGIVVSIPFTVSIFLGGIASIPQDIYEAAYLEGSSYLNRVRHLTLPLLRPFFAIAIILNVIYVFNSFPIIWILTEGGPSNTTDILPTYLYKLAFQYGELGLAAAVSLIMFALLLIFTLFYATMILKGERLRREHV